MHKVMVLAGYKGGFIIRKYSESAEGKHFVPRTPEPKKQMPVWLHGLALGRLRIFDFWLRALGFGVLATVKLRGHLRFSNHEAHI